MTQLLYVIRWLGFLVQAQTMQKLMLQLTHNIRLHLNTTKVNKVKVRVALYGLETHHRATERHPMGRMARLSWPE